MKFSQAYKIKRIRNDNWFDPILNYDTKLFIDPFLIYKNANGIFVNSHKKIINFFNEAFKIVAASRGLSDNIYYKKVKSILLFPEVKEICLGYASGSIDGLGSGIKFSELMIEAINIAIKKGIKDIKHFEELEILNEGIGADRISDMAANILKKEFIMYTQEICKKYNLPVKKFNITHSDFDFENLRWITEFIALPFNPKTLKPIILVPKQYLNRLPTIFSKDFNLYLYNFENERLRNDFNFDIAKKVDKKTIVDVARQAPDIIEKYMKRKEETSPGQSYDVEKDEDNLIKWHDAGEDYVQKNPINFGVPKDEESFYKIIDCILKSFKDYVEFQGGRELLWNDNKTQRAESAAQRTFAGIAIPYCQANNIDISKEVNIGRGPVDFKFSNGFTKKQLIEVKKASSAPNLFRKIKNQLPIYLRGEQARNGVYLIIRYSSKDDIRIENISKVIEEINDETNLNIKHFVVNAEKQPSASKK